MRITEFKLTNFKSFYETGPVTLDIGCNVIIGENNTGKSALLQALGLQVGSVPHRSLKTLPEPDAAIDAESCLEGEVCFSLDEVSQLLKAHRKLSIPGLVGISAHDAFKAFHPYLQSPWRVRFELVNGEMQIGAINEYSISTRIYKYWVTRPKASAQFEVSNTAEADEQRYSLMRIIKKEIKSRVYAFRAERLNVGQAQAQSHGQLESTAANLP